MCLFCYLKKNLNKYVCTPKHRLLLLLFEIYLNVIVVYIFFSSLIFFYPVLRFICITAFTIPSWFTSLKYDIQLRDYTIICLFILLSVKFGWLSDFFIVWKMLLGTFMYVSNGIHFQVFLIYVRVDYLDLEDEHVIFSRSCQLFFSKIWVLIILYLSTFDISRPSDFYSFTGYNMIISVGSWFPSPQLLTKSKIFSYILLPFLFLL